MSKLFTATALAIVLFFTQPILRAQGQGGQGEHWVGTWATAQAAPAPAPPPPINFKDQTLREIVHISLGGASFRIVLSNQFGDAPLAIGAAHVAVRSSGAAIVPMTDRTVTFAGKPGASIAAGAVIFSDPIALTAPPQADLAISIYLPGDTGAGTSPLTMHAGANQTNYVSVSGNHTADADLQMAKTIASWYFLSRVEVIAQENVGAILARSGRPTLLSSS